jgi:hypothetical protein
MTMTTQHSTPTRATTDEIRDIYAVERNTALLPLLERSRTLADDIHADRVAAAAGRQAVYDHGVDHGFTLGVLAHSANIAQAGDPAKHAAESIAVEVLLERDRQDAKWGEQNHPDGTGPDEDVLGDSDYIVGSGVPAQYLRGTFQDATDRKAAAGTVTWRDIILEEVFEALAESDPARLRKELIQAAAVAQQWVEALDRRALPVPVIHSPAQQPADAPLPR